MGDDTLSGEQLDYVLPNRKKFDSLFKAEDLFVV